ncbi:MAG: glycosyltransferase family 2 protein [Rhodobacteraceae bacterium]|nr:glycosyltransferase family 2 protein [Paracoccaceae bacterium]
MAYKLRWQRRKLLWRALRSRHALKAINIRTDCIGRNDILCVMTLRNEMLRLPYFLKHHRALGVDHFLIVDNGSTDGTTDWLAHQTDVSLWGTTASYRAARFGVDWTTWLQMRFAHGHWCLVLDADELLVYDGCSSRDLHGLTAALDTRRIEGFGALMVDLYPKGPVSNATYTSGSDPTHCLHWFDPGPFRVVRQWPKQNLWVQGGVRDRVFFASEASKAPTLNKLPLMRWHRRYAWLNSCHSALPARLNLLYEGPDSTGPAGALLHTKFLPDVTKRAREEKVRRQHFNRPRAFDGYYDEVARGPDLWWDGAQRYTGPESLVQAGLMPRLD